MTPERIEQLLAEERWMLPLARQLTRDGDSARDLLQDTWLRLMGRGPAPDRPVRPWIRRVMVNLSRNRHRGETRRLAREERWSRGEASEVPAVDRVEQEEVLAAVRQAFGELPAEARELITLRYFADRAPREIAADMGLSSGVVRTRLSRALGQLRARLDGRHPEGRQGWCLALGAWMGRTEKAEGAGGSTAAGVALAPSGVLPWVAGLASVGVLWVTLAGPEAAVEEQPSTAAAVVASPPERDPEAARLAAMEEPVRLLADAPGPAPTSAAAADDRPDTESSAAVSELVVELVSGVTGERLTGGRVEVQSPSLPRHLHPARRDGDLSLRAGEDDLVRIDREGLAAYTEGSTQNVVLYAEAPGHAVVRKRIDRLHAGDQTLVLSPCGAVDLEVIGESVTSGCRIDLWVEEAGSLPAGARVSGTEIRVDDGVWRGDWDALHPGVYRLTVTCLHRPAMTVLEQQVTIGEGRREVVALNVGAHPDLAAPVTVGGRLQRLAPVRPVLSLEALSGDAVHVDPTAPLPPPDMAPAPGTPPGHWSWSAELRPGEYDLHVEPGGWVERIQVTADGCEPSELVAAPPVTFEVQVLDADGELAGGDLRLASFPWRGERSDRARWTRPAEPLGDGRFRVTCPAEPTRLVVDRRTGLGESLSVGRLDIEPRPGMGRIDLTVHATTVVSVTLLVDGEVQPFDRDHRLQVLDPDGRGMDDVHVLLRRMGAVRLTRPGTYQFEATGPQGTISTGPAFVTVGRSGVSAVTVELRRP